MNYFQYFLKNSKFLAVFLLGFIGYVIYCAFTDGDEYRIWNLGFAGFLGFILMIAIIGDYLNWRKLNR